SPASLLHQHPPPSWEQPHEGPILRRLALGRSEENPGVWVRTLREDFDRGLTTKGEHPCNAQEQPSRKT
ncbi:unnamed protein product, partial [Rangifer tarandus platyrhynchus]